MTLQTTDLQESLIDGFLKMSVSFFMIPVGIQLGKAKNTNILLKRAQSELCPLPLERLILLNKNDEKINNKTANSVGRLNSLSMLSISSQVFFEPK